MQVRPSGGSPGGTTRNNGGRDGGDRRREGGGRNAVAGRAEGGEDGGGRGTGTMDGAMTAPHVHPAAPTRQLRNKLRTRQRILDAAADLFARQGYERTTVQDIAEAADIALRTFYYHFDSKAALAVAWFEAWADDIGAALLSQPPDATPVELVSGALAMLADKGYPGARTWEDAAGGPTMPAPVWALLEEADPALAGLVYRRLAAGFAEMSDLFRARLGYGEGSSEPDVLAGAVMATWFVAVHGTHGRISRGATPPSFHDTVRQAFGAYAAGLERLWADRLPPGPEQPAGNGTGDGS